MVSKIILKGIKRIERVKEINNITSNFVFDQFIIVNYITKLKYEGSYNLKKLKIRDVI